MSAPAYALPAVVTRMLDEATVPLADAFTLLGLEVDSDLGYRMARRYRDRMANSTSNGATVSMSVLRPRRSRSGEWAEIPNDKIGGKIRCRTDLLLEMVYQEGIDELRKRGAA